LTYPDIDTRCACLQVAARASSRSNSDTWCRFSYVCGRRERARAVSGGVWSSSGNSGAFRLVRGAIAGQESQSVRDHKKVRRKEKLRCRKAVKKTCLRAQSARLANATRVGQAPARRWLLHLDGCCSQRLSSRFGGWCAKLLLSHTSPSEVTPTPVNSPI
jgi:hypothetical protein